MQKNKNNGLFQSLLAIFFIFYSVSSLAIDTANPAPADFTQRKEVQDFIQQMVQKHQFDAAQLNTWFKQATLQPNILSAMAKPAEKLPWYKYEPIFITNKRIEEGVNFWKQHETALKKAEKTYGVPPEVIVAIIGVETFYGKNTGKYKVFDALSTLGFNYPPRSKFFLSELEEFLLLAKEEKWDPFNIKGSYAGAMGTPQFIPSSYRKFAVDFTSKGNRDLINNIDDAIGSVANYFKMHGWQPGKPIAFTAKVVGDKSKTLIANKSNPKPEHSLSSLSQCGVSLTDSINTQSFMNDPFALLALEGKEGPEYWLGAQNFYVITRYNHSDHYALAVFLLSQKIKELMHEV